MTSGYRSSTLPYLWDRFSSQALGFFICERSLTLNLRISILFHMQTQKVVPPKTGEEKMCTDSLLFNSVLAILANAIRQENSKRINGKL